MIKCDWDGREREEGICILKHLVARKKVERGLNPDYTPCLACEAAMKLTLTEDEMPKLGKCKDCGDERTLVGHGLCKTCRGKKAESGELPFNRDRAEAGRLGGKKKKGSHLVKATTSGPKPAACPTKESPEGRPLREVAPRPDSTHAIVHMDARGPSLTLNFICFPELIQALADRALAEIRTPEEQALWLLRQALKS